MYNTKETVYFKNVRKDLLELIPKGIKVENLLEIGAGEGNTLLYAKQNGIANNIYGIELFEMNNSNQTSGEFSKFIIGNIEQMSLPFEESMFDVIILGDVLEHLVDPYKIVRNLKKYLVSNGLIIASIPNIREWNTMKTIFFQGDFKYVESGILDRTHLRFFAKKNIIEIFENNGLKVEKIVGSNSLLGVEKRKLVKRYLFQLRFHKIFKIYFEEYFEQFFNIQYYVVSSKK